MTNKFTFAFRLLSGTSALACASAAYAQVPAETPGVVQGSQELLESADAAAPADAIVVTGSRIARNGNDQPVPVTVVSADTLLQSAPASTIVQSLTELPAFESTGPTNRPGNVGGTGGSRSLALRNLGGNRTLVLFDGRRVPPTSATGTVNADFVPSMLLQRVDVVTGGVSAVYGSDAVAGVVNFITDTNYTGIKVDGRFGISELGDAENYRFGIAGGADILGGRGHIMGSYEYYFAPGVFSKLNREFGKQNYSIQGLGTEEFPYIVINNTALNRTSFLGNLNTGNQGPIVFTENASANSPASIYRPFDFGTRVPGRPSVSSGGDGGYYFNASLEGRQRSHLLYGRFDYELTDNINFFTLGSYMDNHNKNNHESVEFNQQTISTTNAFLPITLSNALRTGPGARDTVTASKIITQVDAKSPDSYVESYMAVAGFNGGIGQFDWEVAYQYSHSQQDTRAIRNTDNAKAAAALDAVDEGLFTTGVRNGNIVCAVTITNPGLYPGCVPLNIFGPTSESPAALEYILTVSRFVVDTTLQTFNAQIAGPVFTLPAGDVSVALSGEYRKLSYEVDGVEPLLIQDCTGLRYNCVEEGNPGSTLRYQSNVRGSRTPVSQEVKEAAAEIRVPLLRDVPLIQELDVTGAVRYTDYSNSGVVYTWKAGVEWAISDALRVRATRSRDIRAPNLIDLFAPRNIGPTGQTDLLTGLVGQVPVISGGNEDLQPEIGNTFTAGVVFRPDFLPGFALAVDYYDIEISDAISNIAGAGNVVQTLCVNTQGTDPLCDLIERPLPWTNTTPANFVTAFYSLPVNANLVTTKGVDVELSYVADVGPGTLSFRSIGTYQPELETTQVALGGTPENAMGADENPQVKISTFLGYRTGPFSVDVRHRWWSEEYYHPEQIASNTPGVDPLVFVGWDGDDRVPAYHTTNLTLGYDVSDTTNVYFGVTNLFDKQPTPIGRIGGPAGVPGLFGGFRNGEDTLGRFFTFGFRYRG